MTLPASYSAWRAHGQAGSVASRLDALPRSALDELADGDVVIRAAWSGVNYKDALAATGAGRILKSLPMVVGIDVSGTVHRSRDPRFAEGAAVLVVGCGLGEDVDGGFAEYVRVRGDWIVPLPAGMSLRDAMIVGTAGFTAGMAVLRMEDNGQSPAQGPVLVNGATGGVGSLAIALLARRGYRVAALTGKADAAASLERLGASEVLHAGALTPGKRPLEKALWAGAVDNLGGEALAWLTRTVQPLGNIASIGMAAGAELDTTVMPFILRGINLLGINSTHCPRSLRERVWARIAADLDSALLDSIVQREVALAELGSVFQDHLDGRVRGRTLVRIGG